ncbi:hypothetical protein GW17_00008664 [Ensete ventricosum]|nr:hypothetical protein GW17_00008664 [Ensete ventricosum]
MTCGIKVRRVKAEVATLVPTHDTSRLPSRNLPSGPFGVVVLRRRRLLTLFSFPSLAALFVSPTSSYRCLLAASLRRSPLRRIPSTSLAIIDGWLPSSISPDLLTASAASTEHMEEETEQSRATQENTTVAIVVIQDGNKCDLDASPKGKDVVEPPSAGMMFKCIDELYEYYKTYGNQVGFPVFKKSTKNDKQGRLHFVTLSCGRGGKSRCKREKSVNPSLTMKIECNAKLNARVYDDGVVRVTSVFLEHNHELSPTRARYLPRRRSVSTSIKRRREKIDQADVTIRLSLYPAPAAVAPTRSPDPSRPRQTSRKARRLRRCRCRHGRAGPGGVVLAGGRHCRGGRDDQERPGVAGAGVQGGNPVPALAPDPAGDALVGAAPLVRRSSPPFLLLPLRRLQAARRRSLHRRLAEPYRPRVRATREAHGYARPVIDRIDVDNKLTHRLYRPATVSTYPPASVDFCVPIPPLDTRLRTPNPSAGPTRLHLRLRFDGFSV